MANILVTGGAGYIGSHTCKHLASLGHTPIVYDNLSRGFERLVKWGPLVKGDLFNFSLLTETMKEFDVKAVIHFAAFAYVGESVQQPDLYFKNNIYGSSMLFEAMREARVENIVFSSTCAVYGESQDELIDETHSTHPINPYGLSKLIVEGILEKYQQRFGFNSIALRYFNAGGADPDLETGECHDPEPHILPNLVAAAIENRPIQIFGKDYSTVDGTCVRDFIHVSDLASAHGLALQALLAKSNKHSLYNLGTGRGFSLIELIQGLQKITAKNLDVQFQPRRPGDPAYLVSSAKRFQSEFGWMPQLSNINDIFKTALAWYQNRNL